MEIKEKKQGMAFPYLKAIWNYRSSHMWCSFALAILLSMLLLFFITMWYMKDRYYTSLIETTYSTERALLESVDKNIENQMETYVNYGSGISVDLEVGQMMESIEDGGITASERKSMKDTLKRTIKVSNSITGIALASEYGVLFQYDRLEMNIAGARDVWDAESEEVIRDTFSKVREMAAGHAVPRYEIITQPLVHPNDNGKGLIHIAFPLKSNNSYAKMRYILVLTFDSQPMNALLRQLNQNQEEYIQAYIEDEQGKILLHTGGSGHLGERSDIYEEDSQMIDLNVDIGAYGWTLHAVINENTLEEKVNKMYDEMVLIFLAAIVLIMFLLFLVTNRILKPVKIISSSISRVKDGDTREQLSIEGTNEIWQLAQEYNEMVQAIRKASQEVEEEHCRVIESMKMQQLAEREALESQINAHFICNTLNVINYEAIDSGNYKVSLLLKKLSNILRYTFDQKHQNVYMFQEISWIEQYLFLQKERMEGLFDYRIEFDSDYDNWPCRKLMLEPFVENSILHGFEGRNSGGMIRITGVGYREFLQISVEDNGCGMAASRSAIIQEILENPLIAKRKAVGIGISNVVTRMRMYYGKEFKVSFETSEGEGTKFVFLLPMPLSVRAGEVFTSAVRTGKSGAESVRLRKREKESGKQQRKE